jgi:hypothetical protein
LITTGVQPCKIAAIPVIGLSDPCKKATPDALRIISRMEGRPELWAVSVITLYVVWSRLRTPFRQRIIVANRGTV